MLSTLCMCNGQVRREQLNKLRLQTTPIASPSSPTFTPRKTPRLQVRWLPWKWMGCQAYGLLPCVSCIFLICRLHATCLSRWTRPLVLRLPFLAPSNSAWMSYRSGCVLFAGWIPRRFLFFFFLLLVSLAHSCTGSLLLLIFLLSLSLSLCLAVCLFVSLPPSPLSFSFSLSLLSSVFCVPFIPHSGNFYAVKLPRNFVVFGQFEKVLISKVFIEYGGVIINGCVIVISHSSPKF